MSFEEFRIFAMESVVKDKVSFEVSKMLAAIGNIGGYFSAV